MAFITVHQSLSFDTITKSHVNRAAAENHMTLTLKRAGWPLDAAVEAATKGSPVLVEDNGDDETIEIRELA